MKSARQEKILEIINKYEVETQEDLISRLIDEGMAVTQASVSRDIRELKLTKVLTGRGSYRYIRSDRNRGTENVRFNNALADSIQNVDYAGNLIVLKTFPGLASAVATGIDAMHMIEILGCVAGDDCIIIVTRDAEAAVAISHRITKLINS